jgi:hypothetical protein
MLAWIILALLYSGKRSSQGLPKDSSVIESVPSVSKMKVEIDNRFE